MTGRLMNAADFTLVHSIGALLSMVVIDEYQLKNSVMFVATVRQALPHTSNAGTEVSALIAAGTRLVSLSDRELHNSWAWTVWRIEAQQALHRFHCWQAGQALERMEQQLQDGRAA